MAKTVQAFKFQPFSVRQKKIMNWWMEGSPVSDRDGIIADGAIRSGKSLCMSLSFVMWAMDQFDGQNFGMCGKSVGSFRRNVLFWLKLMLTGRHYKHEERRSENLLIVRRGRKENYFYIFGGKDERSQDFIQGITLAGVFLDEVALMPESFVNQATGRCSVDGSKMWFNCNPAYPSHWFKTGWIDRRKEKNLLYLHFTMDDNLSLSEKVKNRYKMLYSGVFYKRYILGLWALAEGIIYPMYEQAIEEVPNGGALDYCLSIDYGTMNAFACMLWEKHGNVWYASRCYYYSGRETGITKTDEEYAVEVDKLIADIMKPRQEESDLFRKMQTIIDPSAASFITLLKKRNWYKVIPADNDVMDGIRETATAMMLGLIKISPALKDWRREVEGYAWDDKSGEDRPIKENDHCLSGDTLVLTSRGETPIADLVGTEGEVWSYNIETGEAELKPYHDVRMTRSAADLYKITMKDGRVIRCTSDHPILTDRGYIAAGELKEGDAIFDIYDMLKPNTVKIAKIEKDTQEPVYNMEVEDNHNFAINGGLIVHNCMDSTRYFVKTKRLAVPKRHL